MPPLRATTTDLCSVSTFGPLRGAGLARRLMNRIAVELRDDGRRYIVLSVDTANAAARALYDDLGFVDAARTLRVDIGELLRGHS